MILTFIGTRGEIDARTAAPDARTPHSKALPATAARQCEIDSKAHLDFAKPLECERVLASLSSRNPP